VDTALDIYAWQIEHIKQGLQDVADEKFVSKNGGHH
jgi:hypothetical protein